MVNHAIQNCSTVALETILKSIHEELLPQIMLGSDEIASKTKGYIAAQNFSLTIYGKNPSPVMFAICLSQE